ncbi:BadF/BadG/BcrA/BcrD ATPase family protein [Occultella aeris]|uniref:BadF/BadG/BcrA/BcrD ATPase family protein n=1 Tax=Occultella aeris TaxID=2761496 RepID=A0A7M4DFP7_9MICO|nr:BadF/BadG/BcrA/BcrD ATPase family protein [Occultella aeris]VZO35740.1 BadF/BadG/BcrA/BcrD ATPase family protein [Occultella aeris]
MRPAGPDRFVIAVDSGGTHTRVACLNLDGAVLSTAVGPGGSPLHNDDAAENVARTLTMAMGSAGLDPELALALGAGSSGFSRAGSNQGDGRNDWAQEYYAIPGLGCPRTIVNDAVIAHRGALVGGPGIVVVAGTGSMILAITEDDSEIESGQFEHYAGGARHLVFDVMRRLLSETDPLETDPLVPQILEYWRAADLSDLRRIVLELGNIDRNVRKRRYGDLAPTVTAAADESALADAALRSLASKTADGVAVLAPLIGTRPVPVAVSGSLAGDPAFVGRLGDALGASRGVPTRLVAPVMDPLGGAALIAYELAGIDRSRQLIERLTTALAFSG